jgi:aminopeptidase
MHNSENPRIRKFAEILLNHSTDVSESDNVYLLATSLESLPLFREVRRQIIRKGAFPHEHLLYDSQIGSDSMDYDWVEHASEEQLEHNSEAKLREMKQMDAYIRIGGQDNYQELSNISSDKVSSAVKGGEKIKEERFDKDWATTRYPTTGLAQSAGMSKSELEELIFDAVTETDWDEQKRKNQIIKEKFDEGSKVHIIGEKTDLTFDLAGRKGVNSHGKRNMPDGEVFYAPVKESLEGKVYFNYPGVSSGTWIHDIRLVFDEGKIVEFSASKNEDQLRSMIDTDEGSRFIGEFGIGTNEKLDTFIGETLLDEKMAGTVHLAIGRAYKMSHPDEEKRNKSAVHWDLVKDLRPDFGGGKIVLDGEVVQEDGEWKF